MAGFFRSLVTGCLCVTKLKAVDKLRRIVLRRDRRRSSWSESDEVEDSDSRDLLHVGAVSGPEEVDAEEGLHRPRLAPLVKKAL